MPPKYTTKVESVTIIKEGNKIVGFIARGEACAGASLIYTAELANTETVARFIEPAPAVAGRGGEGAH